MTAQIGSIRAFCECMNRQELRFVYILRSEREPARHYVGTTSIIQRRLEWHNAGQNVHTASNRPWIILVVLEFRTEDVARRFQRYLKSGSGRAFAKRHFSLRS
jgi:putative endonuclease